LYLQRLHLEKHSMHPENWQLCHVFETCAPAPIYPWAPATKDLHFCAGTAAVAGPVAGVQCNQFGAQEPGSNSDIKSFAKRNYGVTFPLMAKVDVNGKDGGCNIALCVAD
jgi:hypothetical protein